MSTRKKPLISKKTLTNGLTILVKPVHNIPRVESHLWYNVGSKDEGIHEKGMAHLIEHMLFKGTKNLSESDINLISQKLTGDANAFTSQDYTCYTFRFPSPVWDVALEIFADCMQHATFKSQMLASEVKTVIEEMHLYNDSYQNTLLEQLIASIFSKHPYHYPIIGSKYDLAGLSRDDLYAFYKKHYHPINATLVVVGDVSPEDVFAKAEKCFGNIKSPKNYVKLHSYIDEELCSKTVTLYRPVKNTWCTYAYMIPGLQQGDGHISDLASFIVANGRSSRLHKHLINKAKLAIDVECSVYHFHDKSLFCIHVYPVSQEAIPTIEKIINKELLRLQHRQIHEWELTAAKKNTQSGFSSLLESSEQQAFVMGNWYLATGNENNIEDYISLIENTTKSDIKTFFKLFFNVSQQNRGYLIASTKNDTLKLSLLKAQSELLEQEILKKHIRRTPIEKGKWAKKIKLSPLTNFSYPKPKTFSLKNGLDVIHHNNPIAPHVVCIINFKTNYQYEPKEKSGITHFLLDLMIDSTKGNTSDAFHKMLETEGIYLSSNHDSIILRCLSQDLERGLSIVINLLTNPSFTKNTVDRIRKQILTDLDEYWNSPIDFIEQIAKNLVYGNHSYHKNYLGSKKSIASLSINDLKKYYHSYISPCDATLVIVGDLSNIDPQKIAEKYFEHWKGPKIENLLHPKLPEYKPQFIEYQCNRDQVVLGLTAPSICRTHPDYNALALLDIIVTGGSIAGAASSRLFELREKSGLFYVIGGSLIQGAREEPGMMFIKTVVSPSNVVAAQKKILETIKNVGKYGITQEEFQNAKNLLFSSSVELFEGNLAMAQTFLFIKKLGLNFNLFDKQGEILSILKIDLVNKIAKQYCNMKNLSVIHVGRVEKKRSRPKGESIKEEA